MFDGLCLRFNFVVPFIELQLRQSLLGFIGFQRVVLRNFYYPVHRLVFVCYRDSLGESRLSMNFIGKPWTFKVIKTKIE